MPWVTSERYKKARVWQNTRDPRRRRIACSMTPLHFESEIDSGKFDREVDMRLTVANDAALRGARALSSQFHYEYQSADKLTGQPERGEFAFGGRQGQHFIGLRAAEVGYLHWPSRNWRRLGDPLTFDGAEESVNATMRLGIDDADPNIVDVNAAFRTTVRDVWTPPNGGTARWEQRGNGGVLNNQLVLDQLARDYVMANPPPGAQAGKTIFGMRYALDWRDIPGVRHGGRPIGSDDMEDTEGLELVDSFGNTLGWFGPGFVGVRNRGGNAAIRKRFYFHANQWYFVIGAPIADLERMLPGELIIDPPITEEPIAANSDDCSEVGGNFYVSGYANNIYVCYAADNHMGWRFTTVPIDQGATVNSASVDIEQAAQTNNNRPNCTISAEDVDNAATFTSTTRPSQRTGTTATVNDPLPDGTNGSDVTTDDLSTIVQEIVDRTGWANNNALAFLILADAQQNFHGYDDFNKAGAGSARFNADVTTGGGGAVEAALTIALTTVVDLIATGQVEAASALSLSIAADLTAVGGLDAALATSLGLTANVTGRGDLAAALTNALTVAAELDGPGALDAALAQSLGLTADLTAPGALSGVVASSLSIAANVAAAGDNAVSASVPVALTTVADLIGRGQVTAALAIGVTTVATLIGRGQLAGASNIALAITASVVNGAAADLSAAVQMALSLAADVNATGALAASVPNALVLTAVITDANAAQAPLFANHRHIAPFWN